MNLEWVRLALAAFQLRAPEPIVAAVQKVTDVLFGHAHDRVNTLATPVTYGRDTFLTGARRYAENFVHASDGFLKASVRRSTSACGTVQSTV
ncbi:hypothetical protein [Streptomyces sp. NPDC058254]|uniref:hypothetical protein n=1 Tax=Streptomyces sp. NPDC058254 TaxID=3346406 RepID=UPI0036ED65C3